MKRTALFLILFFNFHFSFFNLQAQTADTVSQATLDSIDAKMKLLQLNAVSGNFWNGLSSSDFSRSGWCPGTATQPVYFDLSPWADGREHTLTVAIPQGKPVEGMFSHWAVSGVLIVEY